MLVYEAHFTDDSQLLLRNLQSKIQPLLAKPTKVINHLHCTVWFHGDVARLADSLAASRIDCSRQTITKTFESSLSGFPSRSFEFKLQPNNFELYGPSRNILAIDVDVPITIKKLHEKGRQRFIQMIEELGVSPTKKDKLLRDKTLNWALKKSFKPHISLFKNARLDVGRLTSVDLPDKLQVSEVAMVDYPAQPLAAM